ncbi:MAG: hypothetical protein K8W52_07385 [Deltaproteobacteria bacterium]|nr:hypothetical protein [Deltaproteobacteria bacterium]
MKIDKTCALFFATKIDSKLREALSQCKPGDRKYFEGGADEFLRVVEFDEEKWIGKVVKGGSPVTEVEDIQRNIVSILRRVAPGGRVSASSVKMFVLQTGGLVPAVVDDDEGEAEAEAPVPSGPYIANY